ncbi:chemotaxis protein CheW [Desulfatirhabdium butyrativorans]|uniref:chemotaxis protein CheW n=1 Tax=Desulfatirhabdium butyrativorans TaxID=340467 RepID=UPI000400ED06|nr:chemotaxis protein CheW [Desulfatirhabdium butyrativorans]
MSAASASCSKRIEIVTVCIGDHYFGICMDRIQEIIRTTDITPVCLMPDYVAGIMNLRGQIVTLIDLESLLMGATLERYLNRHTLIIRESNEPVGFLVRQIGDVIERDPSEAFEPPSNLIDEWVDIIRGVIQDKGQLIGIFDMDRLLEASLDPGRRRQANENIHVG